jgi:radical SAM superfamily enzyme YgiQ (UPF0313 family)
MPAAAGGAGRRTAGSAPQWDPGGGVGPLPVPVPDVHRIIDLLPKKRQSLFFSATLPAEVRRLAQSMLTNPRHVAVEPEAGHTPRIEQRVLFVDKESNTPSTPLPRPPPGRRSSPGPAEGVRRPAACCTAGPPIRATFAGSGGHNTVSKKILLVHPEFPTTYWSFEHALPFVGKKASLPPLGLMTVAAMLPPDYPVRLVDLNVAPLALEDLLWADLVFISAMIVQKKSFDRITALCREHGKPVVAGGPYPISMFGQIEGVDHFVLDEAELTLPRFLRDLEKGCPERVYRDPGKPDLIHTPPPRFDLIDVKAYDSMPLQYSRGCPYNCEFCDIIEMFGRVQRTKNPAQFLRELDAVLATGFRGGVFIVDDNFIGNRRKTRELLAAVAGWQREHGHPFPLSTEASIDLAQDEELLDLMVEAGFVMVFVGIETPDKATLAFTQKSQNLKTGILASVRKIQEHGIEVTGGFIVGFDTDTADIYQRQIDFIQEAGIPVAMVGLLNAVPNTQLHKRLQEEGRLLADTSGNNTHTLRLNFVPRRPEAEVIAGYKHVLATLYSPASYFQRCATLLRRQPRRSRSGRAVSWSGIRALLRSVILQAFSPYGWHYLRLLANTALRRPTRFPDAVAHAIKGHHLFTITAEILKADAFSRRLGDTRESYRPRVAAALTAGQPGAAATLERRILRLVEQTQRDYRSFRQDAQDTVRDVVNEFAEVCAAWIRSLRLARVRVRAD